MVFGCLAIASNPSRNVDKFTERGVPCVFLGYPQQQKEDEPLINTQPTLRRSTRSTAVPVWHKYYYVPQFHVVLTHVPISNHVPSPCLESQFQVYMSTLLSTNDPTYFKEAVVDSADGTVDKKKTRLVVDGNRQRKGIDYAETFALLAKMVTVRSLLAVDAMYEWNVCQMDVSNTFIHGHLLKEVYMKIPQGYVGQGDSVNSVFVSTTKAAKHLLIYILLAPEQGNLLASKSAVQLKAYCDSDWASAANPVFHARTKHIKVDCHYVRDKIKDGTVKPRYVSTKNQLADMFTKIIGMDQQHNLLHKLGVIDPNNTQLKGEYSTGQI
ncbi:uncharacterized protein [Rutidosis leptorrhynchoides]|uniref:uncharacterized protein n=1 Tax=Rutidosis leptorrhynchoides TaxID=125765 RepID=UPI003A99F1C6